MGNKYAVKNLTSIEKISSRLNSANIIQIKKVNIWQSYYQNKLTHKIMSHGVVQLSLRTSTSLQYYKNKKISHP